MANKKTKFKDLEKEVGIYEGATKLRKPPKKRQTENFLQKHARKGAEGIARASAKAMEIKSNAEQAKYDNMSKEQLQKIINRGKKKG